MSDVKQSRRERELEPRENVLCLKQDLSDIYAIKQQKHIQELVVQYKGGYYLALLWAPSCTISI